MAGGGAWDMNLAMGFKRNWDFIREKFRKELAYELIFGNVGSQEEIERMMSIARVEVLPTVAMIIQADSDIGCCFKKEVLLARRNAMFGRLAEMAGRDGDALTAVMGSNNILAITVGDREIAVLLPVGGGVADEECVRLSINYARYIKVHLEKDLDFTVTASVGNAHPGFRDVKNSYNEARRALVSKFYKGNGSVIHFNELEICSRERQQYFIEFENLLLESMRRGDWEKVPLLTDELVDTVVRTGNVHPDTIKVRTLEMLTVLSRAAIELGGDPGLLLDLKVRAGLEIGEITTALELKTWLAGVAGEICRFVRERQSGTAARAVARAKQYINENYARDISLDDLARHVFLSPFYLSRVFSEEAGVSITDYLKKVRMNKAQSLLIGTDKPIAEIALAVGYKDPNYFSRVFKSITGKAPHQYRKGAGK
ncbi:MAG: helix-turn-helix domain-containing protein [Peptococcaceae bacterium]|nr:helix-turn-helix domain-containing protein [Peptococcaceae bacterium]